MLILGGACVALAIDLEATRVARWLQEKGIAAFVLKYRIPEKKGEGIPQDLIYLAQAESGFFPLALSRAGARGMWQFMGSRARGYGLSTTNGLMIARTRKNPPAPPPAI